MNPKVDHYLSEGCGRCSLGGTPECKVHRWSPEMRQIRRIVLDCMLDEDVKWGVPCYTLKGKNVVLIHGFKEYCALLFMKGALLKDELGILHQQTENVQSGRQIRFTNTKEILELESELKAYIFEAIEVEKSGLKIKAKTTSEFHVVDEFKEILSADIKLKTAFENLTPGRQRAYLLHFAQPKQSATRISRIEKCIPQILLGIGIHDEYRKERKMK